MLRIRLVLVGLVALSVLDGCGFVHAHGAGKSKPNGFVLRGYASVTGAAPGAPGSLCESPPGAADVRPAAPVRVTDPGGRALGTGPLGAGVLAVDTGGATATYRCNFPFEIRAVPGGEDRYLVAVGDRPPVGFPAVELRQDKPAVVVIEPS